MERTEIDSNICGLYIEDKATLKIRKKRDYIFNSFRTEKLCMEKDKLDYPF